MYIATGAPAGIDFFCCSCIHCEGRETRKSREILSKCRVPGQVRGLTTYYVEEPRFLLNKAKPLIELRISAIRSPRLDASLSLPTR